MNQYVPIFEEFIKGKDVIRHIKSITPSKSDVPDYFIKLIKQSGREFEKKQVRIADLLANDPALAEYVEYGEDRYEDAQDLDPDTLELPVVVFGNDVFDGYNRIAVKHWNGEEFITAYVAV